MYLEKLIEVWELSVEFAGSSREGKYGHTIIGKSTVFGMKINDKH